MMCNECAVRQGSEAKENGGMEVQSGNGVSSTGNSFLITLISNSWEKWGRN